VTAMETELWPSSSLRAVARLWRSLESSVGEGGLTSSWDWTLTWLLHFGDLVPYRFAVGFVEDRPRAMALLCEGAGRRGPLPVRTLHVGTSGTPPEHDVVVEFNRLLVAATERDDFAAGLLDAVRATRTWDELRLDGFASEDSAAFLAADPSLEVRREPCHAADLQPAVAAGGDVLAALRAKARYDVRRQMRELPEARAEVAETREEAAGMLDELIALHQARWEAEGERGAFGNERVVVYHHDLVSRLLPSGRVVLARVVADGGTVGCVYGFVERGRFLLYQQGLASRGPRLSAPGYLTHALCMQALLERGLTAYDFLAGDSVYKRRLANTEGELLWLVKRRRRVRLMPVDGLRVARRWMRSRHDREDRAA
jgi:Acetyltransferase (GNAT) domain